MRLPKLGTKKVAGGYVYWFTKANGGANFGRTDQVTKAAATTLFHEHMAKPQPKEVPQPSAVQKVAPLTLRIAIQSFINELKKTQLSQEHIVRRNAECNSFASYWTPEIGFLMDAHPTVVTSSILADYLNLIRRTPGPKDKANPNRPIMRGLCDRSVWHAEAAIRHLFTYLERTPELKGFRPFAGIKGTTVVLEPKNEASLITQDEIRGIMMASEINPSRLGGLAPEVFVKKFGADRLKKIKDDFVSLMKIYMETGARTGELPDLKKSAFNPTMRTITIENHKNAKKGRSRILPLSVEAYGIIESLCKNKRNEDYIFLRSSGAKWNRLSITTRFRCVRRIAGALGYPVRPEITVYDFRHRFISRCLMSGVQVATVAKMAGNSVSVIEKTYANFTSAHFSNELAKVDLSY